MRRRFALLLPSVGIVILALIIVVVGPDSTPDVGADEDEPRSPAQSTLPRPAANAVKQRVDVARSAKHSPGPGVVPEESIWDDLGSMTGWQLVEKHWPRANSGDGDSMLAVYHVMHSCRVYKKRFDGKTIHEVREEFALYDDPALIELNESVWESCGPLYSEWDNYEGWSGMLEQAAAVGQPYAMVLTGISLVNDEESYAEGVARIESALLSGDPYSVAQMSTIYYRAGIDENIAFGWLVAACRLGLDCSDDGSYMAGICGPFSTECGIHESVRDYLVRELGDYGYMIAQERGTAIVEAIQNGKIGDLQIRSTLK